MSMTSSFHGEGGASLLRIAFVAAASACLGYAQAPDSPRPAPPKAATTQSQDDSAYRGSIELKSVRVRRLDSTLQKMAGPEFLRNARDPLAIEVQTVRPLPTTPRDTSAILIINEERFADTWMIRPDKLVVFVDRARLRPTNSAAAAWSGSEASSISKKPLTFQVGDVIR